MGHGNTGARLGYTRPPLLGDCSAIPDFRKIIVAKIKKLAEIGADGLHIDKFSPDPGLDFNPLSTLSPDQATTVGRLLALEEILQPAGLLTRTSQFPLSPLGTER